LHRFVHAIKDEVRELEESIAWKWWRKDKKDMENVRVELIDILHFVMSACMASGMTGEDVANVYYKKRKLNIDRQNPDVGFKADDNKEQRIGEL
jgi:dimeric dUTPase (all-alpha-NTP-PPase superfamily)